jgi:curved DNA-binding protein CbpA
MDTTSLGKAELDQIIGRLRERSDLDERTINRIYRKLVKRVHPDRIRDDGTTFLYLQEAFDRFVHDWSRLRREREIASGIDPHRIFRELGITGSPEPRAALFISIYRFRALGLTSRRVRVNPSMRRINDETRKTLMYWAIRYDDRIVSILERFLHGWNFSIAERHATLFFMIRRTVLNALDSFLRYEDSGRPASRSIAEDRLRYARMLASSWKSHPAFASLIETIDWLLQELEKPPVALGLDL